jgi:hypothetical protein
MPRRAVCSESSEPAVAGGNFASQSCFAKTRAVVTANAAIALPTGLSDPLNSSVGSEPF